MLLFSRVFIPCVIVTLLLFVLNIFPISHDLSNSELGPLLSAFAASIRKPFGVEGIWMVGDSLSGFDCYSHFEKGVFLLKRLGRVCHVLRQKLGAKELVAERALF